MIDEKAVKAIEEKIIKNAHMMALTVFKGDRAQVGPGPNGIVKITSVKEKIIKTVR